MMEPTTEPGPAEPPVQASARVAWGVVVGVALAVPLGYLLTYAAFLMAMLGLFFFILFGLLMGAAMYRVWVPLRPMAPRTIKGGVALVVLAGWGGGLVWEGITFPSDVAKEAIRQVEVIKLPGKTREDIRAAAARAANDFLVDRYPPGGVIGYWRWAATEKTIGIPIMEVTNPKPIRYHSNGWMFIVRVLLCGVGLALAVHSQVGPLSSPLLVEGAAPDRREAQAAGGLAEDSGGD